MALKATYQAECDGCGAVETIERTAEPGQPLPTAILPAGWYEDHEGKAHCPKCAPAARARTHEAGVLHLPRKARPKAGK